MEELLAADVVTVAKRTKNGLRDVDARAAVVSASVSGRQVVPYCRWSYGR